MSESILIFEVTDKTWANGGTFGPEGGLIVTIVLTVEIVSLLIPYMKKK